MYWNYCHGLLHEPPARIEGNLIPRHDINKLIDWLIDWLRCWHKKGQVAEACRCSTFAFMLHIVDTIYLLIFIKLNNSILVCSGSRSWYAWSDSDTRQSDQANKQVSRAKSWQPFTRTKRDNRFVSFWGGSAIIINANQKKGKKN